ncbi:MAG TPA: alpha/beta hydrolase [Telluria sp.]
MNIQSSGSGMPLVWAHGLMSSIAAEDALGWFEWNKMPDGVRLIRYDARGHGHSGPAHGDGAYQWRCQAADLLAVADTMDAPGFIAGGMSMGCASAIHAAVLAPGRIRGLVLAMPPMIWENRADQRQLYQRIAERGIDADARAIAKLMSRDMARTLPPWLLDPGHAASMAIGLRAIDPNTIPDMFRGAALSDLPPRAALAVLADIPTLILGWSGDSTHPVESGEELHRMLPCSELHIAHSNDEFKSFPGRIRAFGSSLA